MAFTDHSDVYGAFHEEGVNRILRHVMEQRPSLFNYGTQYIADNPKLLCQEIRTASMVEERENPLIEIVDPLPVVPIGDELALDYSVQVTDLELDLHPGNVFRLPAELGTTLGDQQFALRGRACIGLGCPPPDFIERFKEKRARERKDDRRRKEGPETARVEELICFCLQLFVVGHMEPAGESLQDLLRPVIDGIELVDLRPDGLESSLECYIKLIVDLVLLPQLSEALEQILPGILEELDKLASVTLVPALVTASLPHNPAVEGDQLKLFIDIEEA